MVGKRIIKMKTSKCFLVLENIDGAFNGGGGMEWNVCQSSCYDAGY
jgi:hypothetical protein